MELNSIIENLISDPAFAEGEAWKRIVFNANQSIIRENEVSNKLYFIEEGILRVSIQVELQNSKTMRPGICDLESGDIVGETCLLGSGVRKASVMAVSKGCALEIDAVKLNDYLEANPQLGFSFFKQLFLILVRRLQNGNSKIESLLAWGLKAHGIEQHL
jgi:CRP-like cAMP-binding protein